MATVKRKSNAVESSSTKALAKRQRTDATPANSDNLAEKNAGKSSKAGAGSSKPGNPIPTSLWKNEQPAFPRGGASLLTPIERKQIEAQAARDALKEHARVLKLDGDRFDTCLDSGAETGAVKKDLDEAKSLGLTGTPSFFVNGHFFSGVVDYAALKDIVNQQLNLAATQHQEISKK